jgi:hypothetical protein
MADDTYQFRPSLFRKDVAFHTGHQALTWSEGDVERRLAYSDIRRIRTYDSPGAAGVPASGRCIITPARGRKLVLTSLHYRGLADFEDRAAQFQPFISNLISRVAAANPAAELISGMPIGLWVGWIVIAAAIVLATPFILLVAVALWTEGEEPSVSTVLALAFCLAMLLGIVPLVRIIRRNRPRSLDPRADGRSPS